MDLRPSSLIIMLALSGLFLTSWDGFQVNVASYYGANHSAISVSSIGEGAIHNSTKYTEQEQEELTNSTLKSGEFNPLNILPNTFNLILNFFTLPLTIVNILSLLLLKIPININPLLEVVSSIIMTLLLSGAVVFFRSGGKI